VRYVRKPGFLGLGSGFSFGNSCLHCFAKNKATSKRMIITTGDQRFTKCLLTIFRFGYGFKIKVKKYIAIKTSCLKGKSKTLETAFAEKLKRFVKMCIE
jgi:hypothetical protein